MINLTTTIDGFRINEVIYTFEGNEEILSHYQAHVPTDRGIILVDTYMTINEEIFHDINDFLTQLYGK